MNNADSRKAPEINQEEQEEGEKQLHQFLSSMTRISEILTNDTTKTGIGIYKLV